MRQIWRIDNTNYGHENVESEDVHFYVPDSTTVNSLTVHLDGYILPRIKYYEELCHLEPLELIRHLRAKYGKAFVHYIKGAFCILLIDSDGFEIYTDRHGIQNFFVYNKGTEFVISNSIEEIASRVSLVVDKENAAMYTLLSHFIGPATLFQNVSNSEAGSYLEYRKKKLTTEKYWQPEELVAKGRKVVRYEDLHIAKVWKDIAAGYVDYLKPAGTSLTITSGNDSRMVLAALLAQNIHPHTFTYGNPDSFESVVSAQVAKAADLDHSSYFVATPDIEWMERRSKECGGMVSIQRAHRLDAYEKESKSLKNSEMVFTGLMGGEYVKMSTPNSSALPKLLLRITETDSCDDLNKLLVSELESRGFRTNEVNVSELGKRIKSLTDRTKEMSQRERDFVLLYLYYGCAHHSQEARILAHLFKYPVHMFMDVDFLQLLSSSIEWYPNNAKAYNRLTHSRFMVSLTHLLAPQLSCVPYGKRGQYCAEDILFKPWLYLFKRLRYIIIKERDMYPPGFVVGRWMSEFCNKRLNMMSDSLESMFNMPKLHKLNEAYMNGTDEYSWRLVSNPINLGMIYEHYTKS